MYDVLVKYVIVGHCIRLWLLRCGAGAASASTSTFTVFGLPSIPTSEDRWQHTIRHNRTIKHVQLHCDDGHNTNPLRAGGSPASFHQFHSLTATYIHKRRWRSASYIILPQRFRCPKYTESFLIPTSHEGSVASLVPRNWSRKFAGQDAGRLHHIPNKSSRLKSSQLYLNLVYCPRGEIRGVLFRRLSVRREEVS